VGFLYGWALLLMIETGAIAAGGNHVRAIRPRLVDGSQAAVTPVAVAAIVLLSAINYFGVKMGSRVLNVLVVLKVAALAILIVFAWFQTGSPGWLTAARVGRLASPHR
jgi:APA family basic amino acid/polyamine antiporter